MTPNLIGEDEFAVFLKDDHMVIIWSTQKF
jgi:hypothetical protein